MLLAVNVALELECRNTFALLEDYKLPVTPPSRKQLDADTEGSIVTHRPNTAAAVSKPAKRKSLQI